MTVRLEVQNRTARCPKQRGKRPPRLMRLQTAFDVDPGTLKLTKCQCEPTASLLRDRKRDVASRENTQGIPLT
jgi:hypothetical protein